MLQIKDITKSQWDSIPDFIKNWTDCVLSPVDDELIRQKAKAVYELLDIKDFSIVILDNPIFIAFAIVLLNNQLGNQIDSQLISQLYSQLISQLSNQLYSQLISQLDSQLSTQISSQLYNQLYSQLDSQLRNKLDSQLYSQLDNQFDNQIDSQLSNQLLNQLISQLHHQLRSQLSSQLHHQLRSQLDNQFDNQIDSQLSTQLLSQIANWYVPVGWSSNFGYYKFITQIKKDFINKKIEICGEFANHCFVVFPFKNILFCSRKPITRWKNGFLHSDKEPAIEFRGGYNIWCLNGVKVTKEIVETPAERLDPQLIMKETNAEVRREIVRKIGIEQVCQKLNAKVLDKQGDYELINLDVGNRFRPYLKMINPSTGTYHIEGIEPNCKTVEQALNWRNGTNEKPFILT